MKIVTNEGVVNTDKAVVGFCLDKWNGSNNQYGGTGLHADLYLSETSIRWYRVNTSQWQGSEPSVDFLTEEEAWKELIQSDTEAGDYIKYFSPDFVKNMEETEI